jgi:hypothetical protein
MEMHSAESLLLISLGFYGDGESLVLSAPKSIVLYESSRARWVEKWTGKVLCGEKTCARPLGDFHVPGEE